MVIFHAGVSDAALAVVLIAVGFCWGVGIVAMGALDVMANGNK